MLTEGKEEMERGKGMKGGGRGGEEEGALFPLAPEYGVLFFSLIWALIYPVTARFLPLCLKVRLKTI